MEIRPANGWLKARCAPEEDEEVEEVEARISGQFSTYGPQVPAEAGQTSFGQLGLQLNSVQQSIRCTVARS